MVAILLLGGLGLVPTVASPHGLRSEGTYVTTAQVDVKAGPDERYDTVRRFRKGTTFEAAGKHGTWLKVQLSEHEANFGYVDKRFAVIKDHHARIDPRPAIPGTYLTTKQIDVRLGPGNEHPIVATIPKGNKIIVVGREGDWLRIASRRGDPPVYVERKSTFVEPAD